MRLLAVPLSASLSVLLLVLLADNQRMIVSAEDEDLGQTTVLGPRDLEINPVEDKYDVGDILTCSANGNPTPEYVWQNMKTFQITSGHEIKVLKSWAGTIQILRCKASNIIANVEYSANVFQEVYVNPVPDVETTTPTITTTTETTTPTITTTTETTTPTTTTACDRHCKKYSPNTSLCSSGNCKDYYAFSPVTLKCEPCSSHCKWCDNNGGPPLCHENGCEDGYTRNDHANCTPLESKPDANARTDTRHEQAHQEYAHPARH